MQSGHFTRRRALVAGGALLGCGAVFAQPGKSGAAGADSITVAQIFDGSTAQQDVSKDFLIGSRAAWQDVNAHGGIRGRRVQHLEIEIDGSRASAAAAVATLKNIPSCVALCGTAGDIAASRVVEAMRAAPFALAHVAPWLQNSSAEVDDRSFPIFAGRQEQVTHALKSLSVMNVAEIGVVYATEAEQAAYQEDVGRTAAQLKVKLQSFHAGGDLLRLGQRLTQSTPAILLFVGGTPELVQFTQGLDKQSRQRYVIALADVNLQTLVQMGAARTTPVIATQAVPIVTSSLPIVRSYREVLARLFDEPPTPLSLAGFIAARYAYEVLAGVDGQLTRQSALAAFQRRASMDLGGWRIHYDGTRRRSATFVTQSMLGADGRVIG